ncbi:RloB family protein [Antribacter soli]|uniref:RloB family protein n=1 Tax=Antribacter soli TaxID=2910976 RepID=UPI00355685DA
MAAKRGRSIQRPNRPRKERTRILIVAEGPVTERQYLQGLVQHFRRSGISVRGLDVKGLGQDPERIVQRAIDDRDRAIGANEAFDEVWAVVDVDEHASLDKAIALARKHKIPMVISNPCFEIWLLWHHEDCRRHETPKSLSRRLENFGIVDKSIPSNFPYGKFGDAIRRAVEAGNPGRTNMGGNPSTSMPDLVATLHRE